MGEMGCLGGEIKDLLRIRTALVPLREPAGRPGDGEEHGEHVARDAQRAQHDPRVEVHIRVELALDKVLVGERRLLELPRERELRRQTRHLAEHVRAHLAEEGVGARVVVLVDAASEVKKGKNTTHTPAPQPPTPLTGLGVTHHRDSNPRPLPLW